MTVKQELVGMTYRDAQRHLRDRRLKFGDVWDIQAVRVQEAVAEAKHAYFKRRERDEDFNASPPVWDDLTLEQAQHYILWGRTEF